MITEPLVDVLVKPVPAIAPDACVCTVLEAYVVKNAGTAIDSPFVPNAAVITDPLVEVLVKPVPATVTDPEEPLTCAT